MSLGQTQKIVALALRQDGGAIPVSVDWQVEGNIGTIQGGELQAKQAGSGTVIGTLTTADGRTLTTKIPVTVDASVPVQVELAVTPSVSLVPGGQAHIQVTLRDPAGQLVPGEVDLNVSVSDPSRVISTRQKLSSPEASGIWARSPRDPSTDRSRFARILRPRGGRGPDR